MSHVFIVAGARTPLGAFQGGLTTLTAPELSAITIQETLQRANLVADDIQEALIGCVLSAGLKQNPARQAVLLAGLPESIGAITINKVCGSGMQTVMLAHALIQAKHADVILAGGMESMSNAPYLLDKARSGYRMGHGKIKDHMFIDGLEDAATSLSMGVFAQEMADQKGYAREQMDEFAVCSLQRAQHAISHGYFRQEIVPIHLKTRQGEITIEDDEPPFAAKIEKIALLKPAFKKDGTITAANASSIADGAATVLIASQQTVQEKNLRPLARIVGTATHAQQPAEFTLAPVGAIQKLLDKISWTVNDVDVWEINEAFAMVTMIAVDTLKININKVNIHGGACALGHPLGATGTRIILTLIYTMQRIQAKRGIAALCIGGGEATAIAIELV